MKAINLKEDNLPRNAYYGVGSVVARMGLSKGLESLLLEKSRFIPACMPVVDHPTGLACITIGYKHSLKEENINV